MTPIFEIPIGADTSKSQRATVGIRTVPAWVCLRHAFLLGLLGCSSTVEIHAEEKAPIPDKSAYTLFNSTPRESMRPLSTDRPDQTESAYTVDAGHFQIELDFLHYTYDRDRSGGGEVRTRSFSVAPFNLKVGLLNNMDLQLVVDPYVRSKSVDRVAGTTAKGSGFGDVTTRLKINFWGNDNGTTAFAMMPFMKWPLSATDVRNGQTEGGALFMFCFTLPASWSSTAMTGVEFVDDDRGGLDAEFVNSITFGRGITEKLGGYVEFIAVTGNAPGFAWQGQLDIGFTYALGDNSQLDWGCNFGVTETAPTYQPFVGFSRRF